MQNPLNYFFTRKKDIRPKVSYVQWKEPPLTDLPDSPTYEYHGVDDPILSEVLEIQRTRFELLKHKHAMYGTKNLAYGQKDMTDPSNIARSLRGIAVRLQDKVSRLETLTANYGNTSLSELNESLHDTLADIANYADLATVIASGKWQTGEK